MTHQPLGLRVEAFKVDSVMQMSRKAISSALVIIAVMLDLSSCTLISANRASKSESPQATAPCSIQTDQNTKFTVTSWKSHEHFLVGIGKITCIKPAKMLFFPGTKSAYSQSDEFFLSANSSGHEVGVLTNVAVKDMGIVLRKVATTEPIALPEGESQLVTWITSPKSDEHGGTAQISGTVKIAVTTEELINSESVDIGSHIVFQ